MTDIQKAIDEVIEFNKYIRYIEKNINKKSSDIIKGILEENKLSRRGLDERFKKICISKEGEQLSASVYIKRRQNQMKILQRSTIQGEEHRFNITKILDILEKLEIAQKYEFIKVKINTNNYWNNYIDFNYKKILDFIFSDNTLVYRGNLESYYLEDILKYNKSSIKGSDLDYFYNELVLQINDVDYILLDTQWLCELMLKNKYQFKVFIDYINYYIYEDLNKYKTIFYKTKNSLGDENYKKSIQEINNDKYMLLDKEKIIFNIISDIETNKLVNIKLFDVISKYLDKGIFKSKEEFINTLVALLIKGFIYIEEIKC